MINQPHRHQNVNAARRSGAAIDTSKKCALLNHTLARARALSSSFTRTLSFRSSPQSVYFLSLHSAVGAGANRHTGTDMNTARLDEETDVKAREFHVAPPQASFPQQPLTRLSLPASSPIYLADKKVSLSVGQAILRARNDKKLTQKDLAQVSASAGRSLPMCQSLSACQSLLPRAASCSLTSPLRACTYLPRKSTRSPRLSPNMKRARAFPTNRFLPRWRYAVTLTLWPRRVGDGLIFFFH
jgi:hypothetical protein